MDLELFAYFLVESAGIGVEHSGNDSAQFFVQSAKAIFTAESVQIFLPKFHYTS